MIRTLNNTMKLANGFRIFRALYSVEARSAACTGIKSKYIPDYDPYGPRPPPSDKILNLAKSIAELPQEEQKMIGPLLLLKLMSPGYNITMTGGAGAASEAGEGAAAPVEEKAAEKSAFTVKLEKFDAAAKIKVIKEVRAFTNLGLKEAKDLVEKTPAVLKEGVTKEEGNAILEKIKAAGGVAILE